MIFGGSANRRGDPAFRRNRRAEQPGGSSSLDSRVISRYSSPEVVGGEQSWGRGVLVAG